MADETPRPIPASRHALTPDLPARFPAPDLPAGPKQERAKGGPPAEEDDEQSAPPGPDEPGAGQGTGSGDGDRR
ncbi:hypothetical protein [Streptomyces sp. NPDC097619]|uniref:hypothetical protein n=1 Tax=Streptomyces sp. NPDC097619 TaxID=3157228 RepID=UPI00331EA8A5